MTQQYIVKLSTQHISLFYSTDYTAIKRTLKAVFKLPNMKGIWSHGAPLDGGYMFAFRRDGEMDTPQLTSQLAEKLNIPATSIEVRTTQGKA